MRDFYDIFTLLETKSESIEPSILKATVEATFNKRGTNPSSKNAQLVLKEVKNSKHMREMWMHYQSKAEYAREVAWKDAVEAVSRLIDMLDAE